ATRAPGRPGGGTPGRSYREQEPAWTADILADGALRLDARQRALIGREGYRGVLSVPILIKGQPYGALPVYWGEARVPDPSQVSLLVALAGQAAVALENARLYQAATDRGRRLATLARLHGTLTASLSLEDVLDRVAQSGGDLFGSSA